MMVKESISPGLTFVKGYGAKLSVVGQDGILSYGGPDTFAVYPLSSAWLRGELLMLEYATSLNTQGWNAHDSFHQNVGRGQ